MSALTKTSKRFHVAPRGDSKAHSRLEKYSEAFWFTMSFLLFLALGPFSAIPAFLAVMSLGNREDMEEPEAI